MEYAVKMRRLPQELMMDTLLAENRVSPEMIARMAEKVAAFHKQAETGREINEYGGLETIVQNTEENFSQTEKYFDRAISQRQYQGIVDYTRGFIRDNAATFKKRVQDGYIRDCHGDLHAAHICFRDGICIYDCIEFNDRFRYGDVASEVAFLVMDLDHHRRADLSRNFVDSYIASSRDEGLKELLNFYKCYRAYVRGKVACFKLDDSYIGEEERAKTLEDATGYFDLAYAYGLSEPMLFITSGLVGSGKSVLAQSLAGRLGLVVISSDVTRKRLASVQETEHRFEEFDTGIYTPEFSRKTYDAMFIEARGILSEGGSVIIDASFIKSGERQRARQLAGETGARFFVLECNLEEGLARNRLEQRLKEGSVSDGRWEVYLKQKERYQPPLEVSPDKRVIIDSSQSVDIIVRQVMDTVMR
ncbi:MAG TPA: AAA family ATPase [Dehalococcoidia bacterium]|nr:AAA family ATPase [Dehalococcoidia bacterium]